MKRINLGHGKYAKVDDEDYSYLSEFRWSCVDGYAVRSEYVSRAGGRQRNRHIRMHRAILSAPVGLEVDHINRDRLDNRKRNLRLCSHGENQRNGSIRRDNTSGYVGVTYHRPRGTWQARLRFSGKRVTIGYFSSPTDAAKARDAYIDSIKDEFATRSFAA